MKKEHRKKMIAPTIVTILLVLYFCGYAYVCTLIPVPLAGKLIFGLVPLLLAGVLIYVFIERIKEIRSGEEDDLSKY